MQLFPGKYKGMFDAFGVITRTRGASALLTGFGPTAIGYFMQGALKFGFYEFFKKTYSNFFSPEQAAALRLPIWLGASASAEFIADLALCPNEATRIRLVSQPDFAKSTGEAFAKILKNEGIFAFYKGLGPILFKQVPYTMAKFAVFEAVQEAIYRVSPRESYSKNGQLSVSLASGLTAGVVAAIVSHPADTVLSVVNKTKTTEPAFVAIKRVLGELGSRVWLGLGTRCFMIGTLTAGQFFIYDYIKLAVGVPLVAKK
jgi:solute carrier family 25 phosphate transporter 3